MQSASIPPLDARPHIGRRLLAAKIRLSGESEKDGRENSGKDVAAEVSTIPFRIAEGMMRGGQGRKQPFGRGAA
jgi:hypothetical protein